MASSSSKITNRNPWVPGALWVCGFSVFFVELSASAHYLLAGLRQHAGDLLCVGSTMALFAVKTLVQASGSFGSIASCLRLLPLSIIPFVLIGIALAVERRVTSEKAS